LITQPSILDQEAEKHPSDALQPIMPTVLFYDFYKAYAGRLLSPVAMVSGFMVVVL